MDELEEVQAEAGVMAMPTFQVYKKGAIVDKTTGAKEAKLKEMLANALG